MAAELRQGFAKRKPEEEMEQQEGEEARVVDRPAPLCLPPFIYRRKLGGGDYYSREQ